MSQKTAAAMRIVLGALVLGVVCDAVMRAKPWGLNVPLGVLAFIVVTALLVRPVWREFSPQLVFLAPAALFFAAGFAWRDSATLLFLDAVGLLLVLSVAALRSRRGRLAVAAVSEYPLSLLKAAFHAGFGTGLLLAQEVEWNDLSRPGWTRHLGAVARGLVIAVPFLCLFGALFAAADPVFASMAANLLHLDLEPVVTHLAVTLAAAWVIGGLLYRLLAHSEAPAQAPSQFPGIFGTVEISVALGLLNALFLAFVVVQLRYLFGGDSLVQDTPGLTYADYARRGFFEMVAAAALALPVLLLAHWALEKDPPGSERIFALLAAPLLVMLVVILASAGQRMRLYQAAYGFTELRVYTSAFMVWLGVVLAWFTVTVLRGRRDNFAPGAVLAAFIVTAGLHTINPDAWIVERNLERYARTGRFDVYYAASLSTDAYPALARALPRLGPPQASLLATFLNEQQSGLHSSDWRTWSWSRSQARRYHSSVQAFQRTLPVAKPAPRAVPKPVSAAVPRTAEVSRR